MKRKVANAVMAAVIFGTGFFLGGKMLVGMINDYKTRMNRNLLNMLTFNDWLELIYSGGSVAEYFKRNGYRKIMIYGNGYLGARLVQALAGSDIEVAAVMDRAASADAEGMVIGTDSDIPAVDCIVVTPVYYYETICNMLRQRTEIPIVSIQEMIGQLQGNL